MRRAAVKTARILLFLELLWLAYSYAGYRMTEKTYLVPDIEAGVPGGAALETEGEICSGFTKKSAGPHERGTSS